MKTLKKLVRRCQMIEPSRIEPQMHADERGLNSPEGSAAIGVHLRASAVATGFGAPECTAAHRNAPESTAGDGVDYSERSQLPRWQSGRDDYAVGEKNRDANESNREGVRNANCGIGKEEYGAERRSIKLRKRRNPRIAKSHAIGMYRKYRIAILARRIIPMDRFICVPQRPACLHPA